MTSICIWHQLRNNSACVELHNIDHDNLAISISHSMCHKLGYSEDKMRFQCSEATDRNLGLKNFDVIYLAALVGECSQEKYTILRNIVKRMREGGMLHSSVPRIDAANEKQLW